MVTLVTRRRAARAIRVPARPDFHRRDSRAGGFRYLAARDAFWESEWGRGALQATMRAAAVIGLLLVAGCQSSRPAPAEPRVSGPSAPRGTAADQHPADEKADAGVDFAASVRAALAKQALPAVAAVLDARSGKALALVGQGGVDASSTVLRPGSTMKPLVAFAAAKAGVLGPQHHVTCDGSYKKAFHCFDKHGDLSLSQAIETSCNVYFFDLADQMGTARLRSGLGEFGVTVPSDARLKEKLVKDFPPYVGTGEGPYGVTAETLATAYQKLATELGAHHEAVYGEITKGLRDVVASDTGTGRAAGVAGLDVGGKTGTTQGDPDKPVDMAPSTGWFAGYAPVGSPEIVVAVAVVGGGPGGKSAAPIAHDIFQAWRQ